MHKVQNYLTFFLLVIIVAFISSCNSSSQPRLEIEENKILSINNSFSDGIRCGFLDNDGILWFGTNHGAYSYNGTIFSKFDAQNGLTDNTVNSIIKGIEGNLWFGTEEGLFSFDGNTFTHISVPFSDTTSLWLDKVYPIIDPNAVHSLAEDNHGNLWIGTGGGGAYRYDGKIFTSFLSEIGRKQEDSLYHNWIPSITKDGDGNMWFASMTHGGASRLAGENFTYFMPKDGLTDDMVRSIYMDKSGNIWIGYNGNRASGLSRFNGETMINYYEKDGLCSKNIRAIQEDKKGNIWLGGDMGNLCVFDGKTFSEFTTKDGHNFNGILCIVEDSLGNIWFGGKDGLWRFDGKDVTEMSQNYKSI